MTKSRELGVRNECARAATDLLVKVKPEKYGATLEAMPELKAPAAVDAVKGYGFLTAVQPVPVARPARAGRGEAALPPLRKKAAEPEARRRTDEPGGTDESPAIPRSRKGGDDEDLLP